MDKAYPIPGASIGRSGLMPPNGFPTGAHYEIAGV
jgi:hypothetical protein